MALVEPTGYYFPKVGSRTKTVAQHRFENLIGRGGNLFEVYQGTNHSGADHFALKFINTLNLEKAAIACKQSSQNQMEPVTLLAGKMLDNERYILEHLQNTAKQQPSYLDLKILDESFSSIIEISFAEGKYLTTKLKPGQTLAQYISTKSKLGPGSVEIENSKIYQQHRTEILKITKVLIGAVSFLHSIDIVHLNITPDNVIFSKGKLSLCGYSRAQHLNPDQGQQKQKQDMRMLAECVYSLITGFHPDNCKVYNQGYLQNNPGKFDDPLLHGYISKHLLPLYDLERAFPALHTFLCACLDGNFNSAFEMETAFTKILSDAKTEEQRKAPYPQGNDYLNPNNFADQQLSLPVSNMVAEVPSCLPLKGLFPLLRGVSFNNFSLLLTKMMQAINFVVDEHIIQPPLAGIVGDPRINTDDLRLKRQKIWRQLILLVIMSFGQANYLIKNAQEAIQKQFKLSCWANLPDSKQVQALLGQFNQYLTKIEQRIVHFWNSQLTVNTNSQYPIKHALNPVGANNYLNFRQFFKTAFCSVFMDAEFLSAQMLPYPPTQLAIIYVLNLGAAMFQISDAINLHKQTDAETYFERFGLLSSREPEFEEVHRSLNLGKGLAAGKLLYARLLRGLAD